MSLFRSRSKDKIKIVSLGKKKVGGDAPIFIVAEVANTHEGNFTTAKKMIDEIKETGVDAIKFQLHLPEEEMIKSHPKFQTQTRRSLSLKELKELKDYAEDAGLYFLCTPFSRKAIDLLVSIGVDVLKIGSGETTDPHFVECAAKTGKQIILSTGMSTLEEIREAVEIIEKCGTPFMLLHTVSAYPAKYEDLNLAFISRLRKEFGVPVGLSDHTPEIFSAIASIPYGVSLIEKHYTLDRNQEGTTDHKVSLEPHEWNVLVDGIRKIEKALGDRKEISEDERSVISWARHSVVSISDISAGETITESMVSTKRPLFEGIPANRLGEVVGKRARHFIANDKQILWNDIE